MSLKRVLCLVVVGGLMAGFCSESSAQIRGPLKRTGKFLGLGWGAGNHWRNPAVDSRYYNPYTPHNSSLFAPTYSHLPNRYDTNKGLLNSYDVPEKSNRPGRPGLPSMTAYPSGSTHEATFKPLNNEIQSEQGFGDFEVDSSRIFSEPFDSDGQGKSRVKSNSWPQIKDTGTDSYWNK